MVIIKFKFDYGDTQMLVCYVLARVDQLTLCKRKYLTYAGGCYGYKMFFTIVAQGNYIMFTGFVHVYSTQYTHTTPTCI